MGGCAYFDKPQLSNSFEELIFFFGGGGESQLFTWPRIDLAPRRCSTGGFSSRSLFSLSTSRQCTRSFAIHFLQICRVWTLPLIVCAIP